MSLARSTFPPRLLVTLACLAACRSTPAGVPAKPASPLPAIADWSRGLPPLDRVKVADFKPALAWAMDHKRAEVAQIANRQDPPNFENTIAALERAGLPLADVRAVFDLWARTFRDEAFDAVEAELEPTLLAFDSEVLQKATLARRVEAIYRARDRGGLTAEQRVLTERIYRMFLLAGAQLDDAGRSRLVKLDAQIGELYAQFNQHVFAGAAEAQVVLRVEGDLAGLPPAFREAAAAAAAAKGHPGAWLIANQYNAVQTFLAHSTRRDLREKVLRAFRHKADNGGPNDNDAVVKALLSLRRERAQLLGYASFAEMKLASSMMRSSTHALAWLAALAEPAASQARRDVEDLQRVADRDQRTRNEPTFVLQPWDLRFYEERAREARFGIDEAEVSSYLDVESVREAMFWVAGQLFDLRFTPVPNAPVPSPDLRVWALARSAGPTIGYLYIDAHPRPGKQGGAWAVTQREQQRLIAGRLPVVMVSYNLPRATADGRAPITWFDAVGMFHEFGHALQALLSDVTYPSLAGLNVAGDAVELASQWFEHYFSTPEVLQRFTHHARTGAPLPAALAARIEQARVFCEGIRTTEMLASAVFDLRLHLAEVVPGDLPGLAAQVSAELRAPAQVLNVSAATQAIYLFGDDNYSAQFYSYLWSDELASEVFAAFRAASGPYDKAVAERLRATILSPGASVDPAAGFEAFLGRAPGIDALLVKRGLGVVGTTARDTQR